MADWSRDVAFEPVPGWLSEVVDAAVADLQRPTPIEVRLGYDSARGWLRISEVGEHGSAGIQPLGKGRTELLVQLADWPQEQFFVESRGAWGEARPACPGHSHPAQAANIAGEAWWVCPVDGRQVALIGCLGQ